MAFETFHFKDFTGFGTPKLWSRRGIDDEDESLALFSSVETDETTVRSDMQMLFSQLKAGLNKILGHVTNAIDGVRKSEETLVTEKAVVDYMTALGNGDMAHAVYDADEAVKDAGGIKAFVNSSAGAAIATHAANTTIHVTAAERTTWNSKANGTHSHQTSDVAGLDTALAGKANSNHTHYLFPNTLNVSDLTAEHDVYARTLHGDYVAGLVTEDITTDDRATNKEYVDTSVSDAIANLQAVSYGNRYAKRTEADDDDHTLVLSKEHILLEFSTTNSGARNFCLVPMSLLKEKVDGEYQKQSFAVAFGSNYYQFYVRYADVVDSSGEVTGHGKLYFSRASDTSVLTLAIHGI